MRVYNYWAEPMTQDDRQLLTDQLRRSSWYRRDLDQIEDRSRALRRALLSLPAGDRRPYQAKIQEAERIVRKQVRDRARAPRTCWQEDTHDQWSQRTMLPVSWGTCLQVEDAHDQSQRTTPIGSDVRGYVSPHEGVLAVQYQAHPPYGWRLDGASLVEVTDEQEILAEAKTLRATGASPDDIARILTELGHRGRQKEFGAAQIRAMISGSAWSPVLASSLIGASDSWVQIGADLIGRPTIRSGRTEGARTLRELKFRIGSNGRDPIWAKLYVLIDGHHRGRSGPPKLPDGRVVWVKLVCRRVGLRDRWALIVVVDEACVGRPDQQRADAVGVDIGWRKLPCGGIRIAYWRGSDGDEGELVIPEDVHRRHGKRDSLRSIRDRERDATGTSLVAWIREFSATDHPVRVAVREAHSWKRIARWAMLLNLWRKNRILATAPVDPSAMTPAMASAGPPQFADSEPLERLERWMSHDRHLLAWEAHNDRRMRMQIADRVDQFAVMLSRRYAVICVETRGMVGELTARKEGIVSEDEWQRRLNAQRVAIVAPGAVRGALERMSSKYGAEYREIDPAGTTDRCAHCGRMRGIEDKSPLVLTCPHCGCVEDQDTTASSNLMWAGLAAPLVPTISPDKPRKMGTRRTRRKVLEVPLETDASTSQNDRTS